MPVPGVVSEPLAGGTDGRSGSGVVTKADPADLEARLHRDLWIVTATVVSLAVALLELLP